MGVKLIAIIDVDSLLWRRISATSVAKELKVQNNFNIDHNQAQVSSIWKAMGDIFTVAKNNLSFIAIFREWFHLKRVFRAATSVNFIHDIVYV